MSREGHLEGLNAPQRAAVVHGEGPLLILAGAGSGKTRVITHRLARLVERGVAPWRVLAVTFTNKAAGEMRERAARLLGETEARRLWIGTFHATCARLLRLHADHAGLRPDFQIYDDADQKKLIGKVMAALGVSDRAFTPRAMLARIDEAKNAGLSEEEYAPTDYLSELVARVYPAYQQRLREAGAVDFGDLLLLALRLTDDAEVGPALRARFDHVLVDEFQDTNRVQYRLVQRLASTRNLCVVGDDDQSIYRWRGADVRNILDFERDYPDAHVVKLEQNYRSTEVVLAAANGVIARNTQRKAKRLFTEVAGGEPIIYFTGGDERREAEFVARAVSQLVSAEGRELGDFAVLYRMHAQSRALEEALRAHGLPYRVYGGLRFFDRAEVKDLLAWLRVLIHPGDEVSLERVVNVPPRGIGAATMDKLQLDAQMARRSLWETMRAAVGLAPSATSDSGDEPNRGQEFPPGNKPPRQPDEPLWGLTDWRPPPPASTSGALLSAAPKKKLAAFVRLVEELRGLAQSEPPIDELAAHLLDATGLLTALQLESSPEARDRIGNLEELLNSMRDYHREAEQAGEPTSLASYLERVSLVATADGEGGGVSLMTIHAAKGLEFPVVFLAGLEEGTFPLLGEEPSVEELEEERRLCYVALTRARERLVLTNAARRRLFRGERRVYAYTPVLNEDDPYSLRESRFVADIPDECIARPVAASRQPMATARHDPEAVRVELDEEPAAEAGRRQRAMPVEETRSETRPETRVEYDIEPELAGGFRVGQRVRHEHFGEGRVRRLSGSGPGLRLVIEFGRVGEKTVVARFVQPA